MDLWQQAMESGTPLVSPVGEDGTVEVTFLWRGEAPRTTIGWGLNLELERRPGTDLWIGRTRLPATLRTLYCLVHGEVSGSPRDADGTGVVHVDPLNRQVFHFPGDPGDPSDYDTFMSLLELPQAPPETWSTPQPGVPRGTVQEMTLPSEAFGGERRVAVYRPPGGHEEDLATLVTFDGWLSRAVLHIPSTLDNLIAAGRIEPTLALFVHGEDDRRDDELGPNEAMTRFVARELIGWARQKWGATSDPRRTAITGVSLGGLTAAHIALRVPEVFGGVIAQSGAYWWPYPEAGEPKWLIREYEKAPRADLRFYLDVGAHELLPGPSGDSQLDVNRQFRDVLLAKGYPVTYAEYQGGHDYVNWRNTFADGLVAILGT
ncbi:MAG: alpha/beta hydrolase-fold protein [Actinoplanes sp.]